MSDITKCTGEGCQDKDTCRRYTDPASEHNQSYFAEPPVKDGKCPMYWDEVGQSIIDALTEILNDNEQG